MAIITEYRPLRFDDVVGQPQVDLIRQKCVTGDIPNAFLFAGKGGCGKTTVARLVAMSLNSPNKDDRGNPNLNDPGIADILKGTNPNVIELDMATNRGIENIRDIQKDTQYVPSGGGYRVFILDEAHQVTSAGAAALLKILEEPPKNNLFILCTTDPQKLIPTIRTRCVTYEFKPIKTEDIVGRLSYICKEKNVTVLEDGNHLLSIALASDGSMREAESLLDSCIKDGVVSGDTVAAQLVSTQSLYDLYKAILSKDYAKVVGFFDSNSEMSFDMVWFDRFLNLVLQESLKGNANTNLIDNLVKYSSYIHATSSRSKIVLTLLSVAVKYVESEPCTMRSISDVEKLFKVLKPTGAGVHKDIGAYLIIDGKKIYLTDTDDEENFYVDTDGYNKAVNLKEDLEPKELLDVGVIK